MLADNTGTSCRWSGATRHCTDVERTPCNDHLAPFPCDYSLHTDRTNSCLGLLKHAPSSKLCPQLMHGDFSNRTWRSFRCELREVKVIERKVNVSRELGGKGRERIETLQVQNENSRKLPNWKGFTFWKKSSFKLFSENLTSFKTRKSSMLYDQAKEICSIIKQNHQQIKFIVNWLDPIITKTYQLEKSTIPS